MKNPWKDSENPQSQVCAKRMMVLRFCDQNFSRVLPLLLIFWWGKCKPFKVWLSFLRPLIIQVLYSNTCVDLVLWTGYCNQGVWTLLHVGAVKLVFLVWHVCSLKSSLASQWRKLWRSCHLGCHLCWNIGRHLFNPRSIWGLCACTFSVWCRTALHSVT